MPWWRMRSYLDQLEAHQKWAAKPDEGYEQPPDRTPPEPGAQGADDGLAAAAAFGITIRNV